MTYRGHVKNGVVVLDEPADLPDGAEVRVEPVNGESRGAGSNTTPTIMKHAGIATDLPADASQNLDHYLYGHPKR